MLIKERDLLKLLPTDALVRIPSARDAAKVATTPPRQSPSVVSKRETELLGRINVLLVRKPKRGGSNSLDSRRQEETLTSEEHAELLILIDESERLAVGQADALVELARLWVNGSVADVRPRPWVHGAWLTAPRAGPHAGADPCAGGWATPRVPHRPPSRPPWKGETGCGMFTVDLRPRTCFALTGR